MNRSPFFLLALIPVIAFIPACTDAAEGENGANSVEEGLTLELAVPDVVGTYYSSTKMVSHLQQLVMKMDHKFHAQVVVVCDAITAPCPAMPMDGTFRLDALANHRYLSLYSGSALWAWYEYAKRDNNLVLFPVKNVEGTGIIYFPPPSWQVLTRSEIAWCAAPVDCPLQNLTANSRCGGDWTCGTNYCNFVCDASSNAPPGMGNDMDPAGLMKETRDPDPR